MTPKKTVPGLKTCWDRSTQISKICTYQGLGEDAATCFLKNMQKNARWEEALCRSALNTFEQYIFNLFSLHCLALSSCKAAQSFKAVRRKSSWSRWTLGARSLVLLPSHRCLELELTRLTLKPDLHDFDCALHTRLWRGIAVTKKKSLAQAILHFWGQLAVECLEAD